MKTPIIKKLPSGAYHARVQIDGRRVSVTSNSKKNVEREILSLKLKTAKLGQSGASDTLSEGIDRFIESRMAVLSPATVRGYRIIQRNRFKFVMSQKMDSIKNWQKIVNDESKLVSAKTIKNAWGLVRSVLAENGIDPGTVRLPMYIPKERAFLQPDEIKRFVQAIEGEPHEIAFLACLHGLRASECIALDKTDITDVIRVNKAIVRNTDTIRTLKHTTKNVTSTRTVPVFIPRLSELARSAPEGPLVHAVPLTLNKHLKRICTDNNLPVITLHELRHSFVSLMYHLQIPEAQAMEFGGYADLSTMRKIYTHLATEDRKKAAARITNFFKNGNEMETDLSEIS